MNSNPKIVIVDYGVGNIHSALKAFRRFAERVSVTEEAEEIASADALVLPGVGAFEVGMKGLEIRGLVPVIKNFAASGKPLLGICLGAQLMLEKGYEFGEHKGLGLIAGEVVPFSGLVAGTKIPHMGWNEIYAPNGRSWNGTILSALDNRGEVYPHTQNTLSLRSEKNVSLWTSSIEMPRPKGRGVGVYFVHSFVLKPAEQAAIAALAEYGGKEFCAVMQRGNIAGCQFHPEKSGEVGLKIIENFVRLVGK